MSFNLEQEEDGYLRGYEDGTSVLKALVAERDALKAEIEKLLAALQTARRDALEEAAQYHDKLAAAQQQMFETLVDELYMTVWKTSAKNHRHYAAAIRAMDDGE